jgi:ribosome-binding ATPase YchF (GTP1/OBG family)
MFVGVHNWHNFTSARSHLTIFKAASTLSKDLLLHKSKPPRYVLNTNQNTQTKQKNEQTKENYNEEEDEDEDVVIENGEEEEEEEEEEKEKQQLNGVENAESGILSFVLSHQSSIRR